MNVAIVVYTKTGTSALLARAVAGKLREKGHTAEVLLVKVRGEVNPGTTKVDFESIPEVGAYDTVLVGGPVWAFSASPPLLQAAIALDSLKGKRAMAFVTHGLPFLFTGPRRALRKLHTVLQRKGTVVLDGIPVRFGRKPEQQRLDSAADTITARLCG